MLFNAMRTNRILADVVMETVLVYCNYKDDKASLNQKSIYPNSQELFPTGILPLLKESPAFRLTQYAEIPVVRFVIYAAFFVAEFEATPLILIVSDEVTGKGIEMLKEGGTP